MKIKKYISFFIIIQRLLLLLYRQFINVSKNKLKFELQDSYINFYYGVGTR